MTGAVAVTGAASGIGLALTNALISDGIPVIAIDREPVPITGPQVTAVIADLADPSGAANAAAAAHGATGLVNCAGVYPVTPLLDLDVEEWDRVLNVNLRAPFLVTQALARHWRGSGTTGRVVNVASTAAVLARPGTAHYAASKAGLIQMTKVMAIELAPLGIRVNAVAPGLIGTDRVMAHAAGAGAAEHSAKLARIPLGREGTPDETVAAIRWLLSDAASYATGSVLTLDGGFTLGIPTY